MKHIVKKDSPQLFEDWKAYKNPKKWADLPSSRRKIEDLEQGVIDYSKDELRQKLLEEQGFICCYCNRRIKNTSVGEERTIVEHLQPKDDDKYPELTFEYNNLLASCRGGNEDRPPKDRFCDAAKANTEISVHPLMIDCETHFVFTELGNIAGLSDEAKETIETLNLDCSKLVNKRREIINGYDFIAMTSEEITAEIQLLQTQVGDKLPPFCSTIKNILQSYL